MVLLRRAMILHVMEEGVVHRDETNMHKNPEMGAKKPRINYRTEINVASSE
jgi:hypothetical protein